MIKFSIVISTKNRLPDLKQTLQALEVYTKREDVELIICDDGSTDGTSHFLSENYPERSIINATSKGLLPNRNKLNDLAKGLYVISLDDDANFLSENPLETIEDHFKTHPNCGMLALRIFWNKDVITNTSTSLKAIRVKGFVGCGHVWRKATWDNLPKYPEWFVFYGEEQFASYQLYKRGLEVHFLPTVLIHHRVDVKGRKKDKDYGVRLRRSLRSGWYLMFLFYPLSIIPRRFFYTLWVQFKTKVFRGDFVALWAIICAMSDVFINLPKLFTQSNRLSKSEFKQYNDLNDSIIFWKPE